MEKLVCDLCGGKLILEAGGVAICDSCGTQHSASRMKEKIQEIKGVVRVDNTHMVDNYLQIAANAYDAGNQEETENYCNKVLEISPDDYRAWLLKGKAAGWQSTLQNPRLAESIAAFTNAINNAPEEEQKEIEAEVEKEVTDLSKAFVSLQGNRFAKWPDEEEAAGLISILKLIMNSLKDLIEKVSVFVPLEEIMAPSATIINNSVMDAYNNVVWPDYFGDPNDSDDRANDSDFRKFIDRSDLCINLLEQAIDLFDDDDESDVQRYENIISIEERVIDGCSWDYEYKSWGKSWSKKLSLTSEAKKIRRDHIAACKEKVEQLEAECERKEKEKQQALLDAYWNAHPGEKERFDREVERLAKRMMEIDKLRKNKKDELEGLKSEQNAKLPCEEEVEKMAILIHEMETHRDACGLFKGRERRRINDQIETVKRPELERLKKERERKVSERNRSIIKKKKEAEEEINRLTSEMDELCSELETLKNEQVETIARFTVEHLGVGGNKE